MGQKTHPIGFRLGIIKDWHATWFAARKKDYQTLFLEDLKIRNAISAMYEDAGISSVDIERDSNDLTITIHTARPGIVIEASATFVATIIALVYKLSGIELSSINFSPHSK